MKKTATSYVCTLIPATVQRTNDSNDERYAKVKGTVQFGDRAPSKPLTVMFQPDVYPMMAKSIKKGTPVAIRVVKEQVNRPGEAPGGFFYRAVGFARRAKTPAVAASAVAA